MIHHFSFLTRRMSSSTILFAGVLLAWSFWAPAAIADPNGINRFAVRNCTAVKLMMCAYDKTDSILAIPYHAKRIAVGEKERFSCGSSGRCKVFSGLDAGSVKKILSSQNNQAAFGVPTAVGAGIALNVGGSTAVVTLIIAADVGLVGALAITGGAALLASGAVVGAAYGVVKTIDGFEAGKMCKKMMSDQKKVINSITDPKVRSSAKGTLKKSIKGRWPKYKNYSMIMDGASMKLVGGDKC
jgi:hypothetical protein